MAKFLCPVGFVTSAENVPGVWIDSATTRNYAAMTIRNISRTLPGEDANQDLRFDSRISIVADPYANENFSAIRFIEMNGVLWKVTSVEVQRPRLLLTIGGVYNGPTPGPS